MPCRAHLSQLRRSKDRLLACGVNVVVVTFAEDEEALNYQNETNLEWSLVIDRQRQMYDFFGLARASFWDVWGPATWWSYIKEMLRGNMPKKTDGDIYQRGGDVLIDPQGIVRFHYIGRGPGDRPAVDSILKIVQGFESSVPQQ